MKIVSLVDSEANLGGANQQNVVEFSTIASNTKTDLKEGRLLLIFSKRKDYMNN